LLAESRSQSDDPENAGVRTRQLQILDSFTKLSSGVGAYLRQQECCGSSSLLLRKSAFSHHNCILQSFLKKIIYLLNRFPEALHPTTRISSAASLLGHAQKEWIMEGKREEIVNEARHRGPNLGAVGSVYALLFLASLVGTAIMTKGGHIPSPFISADLLQAFFAGNGGAVRLAAFLQFGAAVPLGIFAATVVSRLQFLGVNVAGVFIALFGGLAAALLSAISALLQWALAQPGVASQADITRLLHLLAFATGGVGFIVALGLFLAGVSVIAWFTRILPRWLVLLGVVIAAIAELSSISLIFTPAAYLLPVARFAGLIWIVATGWLLPGSRAEAQKNRLRYAAA
jgi:hypothetical protein